MDQKSYGERTFFSRLTILIRCIFVTAVALLCTDTTNDILMTYTSVFVS